MPSNPSVFNLSSINGNNGFRIDGEAVQNYSGGSVALAGDINGDGFADFIVGAWQTGPYSTGKSYVVFGKEDGFATSFDFSTLTGANGFEMVGPGIFHQTGRSVSSAGDVNGDGFDDVIIGAPGNGSSYVVFGKAGAFAASFNLSTLDGTNGFIIGGSSADESSSSVSSAGDVNGDGFDDLIVGAKLADPPPPGNAGVTDAGASYVIFGKATYTNTPIDLTTLNGTTGFRLDGGAIGDRSGSVAAAGDVNGDGLADLIVGASKTDFNGTDSGSSYVVFGKTSGYSDIVGLSSLNGTTGFRIDGIAADDHTGQSVASAGDINGDGFDDIIIGAYRADGTGTDSGRSYVVFGKASGFAASLNLANLNGSNGFRLDGVAANDRLGVSVASAGDINGDGFDDFITSAFHADNNGLSSGSSYVVFGKANGYAPVVNLATLNGTNGFRIDGDAAGSYSGASVSSAGDVNGDGFDDILVGAPNAETNGISNSGSSYVIYGRATGTLDRVGTDASEGLGGGDWDDNLYGKGGNDRINAGAGDDYVSGSAGDDKLNGGDGDDTILGGSGNDTINGGDGGDSLKGGSGNDTYTTDGLDVLTESAGPGTDIVNSSASLTLAANFENLNLLGAGNINGTGNALANVITGNGGNNSLNGGADALVDQLIGLLGDDTYVLGASTNDTVTDSGGTDTITSTITRSLLGFASVDNLTLLGSSAINGTGNGLNNIIVGSAAANALNGDVGDDTLYGGKGNDALSGNAGADKFVFDTALSATTNVDTISTLSSLDKIVLDNDIFTALGVTFTSDEFRSIATGTSFASVDASDYIVYLKSTGDIYYDRDGSGTTYSAIKFADLAGGTTVNFSHFLLIE